jgi:hypothetical protein
MAIFSKISHIPPRIAVIVLLIGAASVGVAAFLILKTEKTAQAETLQPLAARVAQADGNVAINHQLDNQDSSAQGPAASTTAAPQQQPSTLPTEQPASPTSDLPPTGAGTASQPPPNQSSDSGSQNTDWNQAGTNTPVTVGDQIYVPQGAKAGIALSGRRYVRLDSGASLDVLSMSPNRTQLALRDGAATFDVGDFHAGDLYEVATPCGAIDFKQPGLYQIGFNSDGSVVLTVLNGEAQVVSMGGSGTVTRGQVITLPVGGGAQADQAEIAPTVAGGIVNDYYSYRYGSSYDGRYADYNTYLTDPYYYDPYQHTASCQYVPDEDNIAGLEDLNQYGQWQSSSGYGNCWFPQVSAGWTPYQAGAWVNDGPLGMSWVATEPWGWAPYHYGRWAYVENRWGWIPGEAVSSPYYSPALVAFVSLPGINAVGWVPLGPGDPWVSRYYGAGFTPSYVGSDRGIDITTSHNLYVAGAVTAVSISGFNRAITPGGIIRVDRGTLGSARPVLDPFKDQSIRQASVGMGGGPRVQVPVAVQREAFSKPVVTTSRPVLPAAFASNAGAMHYQQVSDGAEGRKMEINKSGAVVAARQPNGVPMTPSNGQRLAGANGQGPTPPGAQPGNNQAATASERQAQVQQQKQQQQQSQQQQKQTQLAAQQAKQQAAQQAQTQRAQQLQTQRTQQAQTRAQAQQQQQQAQQQKAQQRQAQVQQQKQQQAGQKQQAQAKQQAQPKQQAPKQAEQRPPARAAQQSGAGHPAKTVTKSQAPAKKPEPEKKTEPEKKPDLL